MRRIRFGYLWVLTLFGWSVGQVTAAHTQARLVLAAEEVRPGETIWAGIHLRMDPDWHTYWRNPGASGIATEVEWHLPDFIHAGPIHWPPPEKYAEGDLVTYVYHREVMLLIPLTVATNAPRGSVEVRAKVAWLECKESCLPGAAEVSAAFTVGEGSRPSADAGLIERWQARLPQEGTALEFRGRWDAPAGTGRTRPVVLEWKNPAASDPGTATGSWDFFPYASPEYEVQAPTFVLPSSDGRVRVRKAVETFTGKWPEELSGLVIRQTGETVRAWEVRGPVQETETGGFESVAGAPASSTPLSLGRVLVYAFVGGLILNVMPCVLPVIALKILGFVNQAREDRRRVRRLGLVYTLGVLASFAVLAVLVIGLQTAGRQAGWGIQFGNPYFLVTMTVLVTLIALNLFGVFEVTLGGRALETATDLARREGVAGAFFSGLLTTVLATSCTAPFLGAAVGFAFVQPPPIVLLVMLTVGAGLAFPYLVLSWQPGWLKWLPRPGLWMEHFKVLMGFPMLAAAVWLLTLVEAHYGDRVWALGYFLVVLAVAAWLYGTFWQRAVRRSKVSLLAALALLAGGYWYLLEGAMQWRSPAAAPDGPITVEEGGIPWRAWSPQAVEEARRQGHPVLVDFTARWCLTCQVNKKFALEVPAVREKLREIGAVAFLADYTHFSPEIGAELKRFGRAGVPLVVVYPADPSKEPMVLPETLTPGIVLEALAQAAR
ncbi:MAG: thiol:disulfide interchange protein [Limisphaera sp.]|nr:MAG: thiol:disulfide interchange protein [Limisphaera sp.]